MNSNPKPYYRYWAKARKKNADAAAETGGATMVADYHLLPYHLLDVAAVGFVLLERDERFNAIPEEAI